MKSHIIVPVFSLLVVFGSGEIESYNASEGGTTLSKPDPTFSITPRKIRFEEDSQYLDPDFSAFEQSGQQLRFEDNPGEAGRVTFQDDNRVEEVDGYVGNPDERDTPTRVTFEDDNKMADPGIKKKRRRRRRKPKHQLPQGPFGPGSLPGPYPGTADQYPGTPGQEYPGFPSQQYPGFPGQAYPGGQGFGPAGRPLGHYYRPPRRPKQSFASEALSKVVAALTSIALYDDYQCVPRLLCEAAGGGALGESPVLQSIAGLQPLLTLLSAYSGISSSPLFVFGRAVFLGMTSKGNTGSCRYAYPQCPTDPEQLVHYLNNHNGGFFRFFNSPQPQIPQNLEQFYNQLSGQYGFQQNYGLYDPQQNQPPNFNQQYGLYQPANVNLNPQFGQGPQNPGQQYQPFPPNQPYPQNFDPQQNVQYPGPSYGFYQPNQHPQANQQSLQDNQQYGLYNNPYSGPHNPNLYANRYNYNNYPQNYGFKNPQGGKYGIKNIRYKNKNGKNVEIEKRIQNKPSYLYIDSDIGHVDVNSKWIFPESTVDSNDSNAVADNVRGGKGLKFPDEGAQENYNYVESNRKGKTVLFPESQSTKYVNYYDYPSSINNDNFKFNYQHYNNGNSALGTYGYKYYNNDNDNNNNRYSNNNVYNNNAYSKYMFNNEYEDGVQTVYVVRGNGDPNHPEIFKVRPGEKFML